MALGDTLLKAVTRTVPIDQAVDILNQPVQYTDPESYYNAQDNARFQANLPGFFRNASRQLLEAQQQQQAQQQQIIQEQQQAQQEQADNEPIYLDQTDPMAQAQQEQDVSAQASMPNAMPMQQGGPGWGDLAQQGQQFVEGERWAQQQKASEQPFVKDPETGLIVRADIAAKAAQKNYEDSGGAVGSLIRNAADFGRGVRGIAKDVITPEVPTPANIRDRAERTAETLHEGLGLPVEAVGAIPSKPLVGAVSEVAQKVPYAEDALTYGLDPAAVRYYNEHPEAVTSQGGTLAEGVAKNPNAAERLVGGAAIGAAAYAPLMPVAGALGIGPKMLDALFTGDALYSTKPILEAYQRGDISGKEALVQAAEAVGPQLGMIAGVHGVKALRGLGEEGTKVGGVPAGVAPGERGAIAPYDRGFIDKEGNFTSVPAGKEHFDLAQNQGFTSTTDAIDNGMTRVGTYDLPSARSTGNPTDLAVGIESNSIPDIRNAIQRIQQEVKPGRGSEYAIDSKAAGGIHVRGSLTDVLRALDAAEHPEIKSPLQTSVDEPIATKTLYHGSQGTTREFKVDPSANVVHVDEQIQPETALKIVRQLNAETGDVLGQHPEVVDILDRPQNYTYGELAQAIQTALVDEGYKARYGELFSNALQAAGVDGVEFPANQLLRIIDPETGVPHEGRNVVMYNPDKVEGAEGFKLDKAKFGTGQGADLWGRGFYMTDNPKIAGDYSKWVYSEPGTTAAPFEGEIKHIGFEPTQPTAGVTNAEPAATTGTEAAPAATIAAETGTGAAPVSPEAPAAPPSTPNQGQAGQAPPTPPRQTQLSTSGGSPVVPGPEVPKMGSLQKMLRYTVRQLGGEFDPARLKGIKTEASRLYNPRMQEAGRIAFDYRDAASTVPEPTISALGQTEPEVVKAIAQMNPTEKIWAATMYPDYFDVAPETAKLIDNIRSVRDKVTNVAESNGAKPFNDTADPEWLPRKVEQAGGVSSSYKKRTTGDFFSFINDGNHIVDDVGLNLGGAMEDAASAQLQRSLQMGYRRLGNFDGKGNAVVYAKPGSPKAAGYVAVDGFTDAQGVNPHNGKMYLLRQDIVAESARNAFSRGLPDVQRALTQPARFVRAVNFAFGPFHAIYENAALGLTNTRELPKTLWQELRGTISGDAREQYIRDSDSMIKLQQASGGQIDFGGGVKQELAKAGGIPEKQESPLERLPKVGQALAVNRKWMFDWIVPWVQNNMFSASMRDWMIKHPDLIPADFETVMREGNPDAIAAMRQRNPEFAQATKEIAHRVNHVSGFTENPLGVAERQAQGGYLSTPTITRAIAANVRDAFSKPGTLRGAMGRAYWRNALISMSSLALAGTAMAQGGVGDLSDPNNPLNPESKKFVLNPASGANFMAIVTPNGTRYSLVPSPIRSPMKALFMGAGTAGTAAIDGGSFQDIMKGGLEGEFGSLHDPFSGAAQSFVGNRLSAPARFGREFLEQQGQGVGGQEALKQAALRSGASDVPLPAEAGVQAIANEGAIDRGALEKAALTTFGATQTGPTPFMKYDQYLRDKGLAEGTKSAPYNIEQLVSRDPLAKKLRDEYEASRAETASPSSKELLGLQQERRNRIQQEQQNFNKNADYVAFRKAVTDIRSDIAQREARLNISTAGTTDDQKTLTSWYDTFDKAKDPLTGQIDDNTLEQLQEEWKKQNPGKYDSVIAPAYEGASLSPTERLLREDRNKIAASGWWDVQPKLWSRFRQNNNNAAPYDTFEDYRAARFKTIETNLASQGLDPASAQEVASQIWAKDPINQSLAEARSEAQFQILFHNKGLLQILSRWGYHNPTAEEDKYILGLEKTKVSP